MKDELSEQQTDAILKALDDAIEHGPWDKSNFLRVIGKNLREIRDGFANQLYAPGQDKSKIASHLANRIALRRQVVSRKYLWRFIRQMAQIFSPGSASW